MGRSCGFRRRVKSNNNIFTYFCGKCDSCKNGNCVCDQKVQQRHASCLGAIKPVCLKICNRCGDNSKNKMFDIFDKWNLKGFVRLLIFMFTYRSYRIIIARGCEAEP